MGLTLFCIGIPFVADEESSTNTMVSNPKPYAYENKAFDHLDTANWMNVTPAISMPAYIHTEPKLSTLKDIENPSGETLAYEQRNDQYPRDTLIPNNHSDTSLDVKRSKSTGHLQSIKINKRQQKWQSINVEKNFLQNVNENLLPSVLKKSESPILAIKRKQQTPDLDSKPLEIDDKQIDSEYIREANYHSKTVKFDDLDTNSVNSAQLPYISEFGERSRETSSELYFKLFDQDTHIANVSDFQIPPTMEQWDKRFNSGSMNHIPYNEWDEEAAQKYQNFRSRSGATTNIPRVFSQQLLHGATLELLVPSNGVDDIDHLSDVNIDQKEDGSGNEYLNGNELNTEWVDDEVVHYNRERSDFIQQDFGFNHQNRSFSAPSLQTFRNVSNSSGKSNDSGDQINIDEFVAPRMFTTPPPLDLDFEPEAPRSSPIKKFSPKKLFRRSMDLPNYEKPQNYHHHTRSNISAQTSWYSSSSRTGSPKRSSFSFARPLSRTVSVSSPTKATSQLTRSRSQLSSSPKKSFKSLIARKSAPQLNEPLQHPKCIAPPTLLKQAIVKKQREQANLEVEWDLASTDSPNESRNSSIPSAVIGEYDREKWTTLKELSMYNSVN